MVLNSGVGKPLLRKLASVKPLTEGAVGLTEGGFALTEGAVGLTEGGFALTEGAVGLTEGAVGLTEGKVKGC